MDNNDSKIVCPHCGEIIKEVQIENYDMWSKMKHLTHCTHCCKSMESDKERNWFSMEVEFNIAKDEVVSADDIQVIDDLKSVQHKYINNLIKTVDVAIDFMENKYDETQHSKEDIIAGIKSIKNHIYGLFGNEGGDI